MDANVRRSVCGMRGSVRPCSRSASTCSPHPRTGTGTGTTMRRGCCSACYASRFESAWERCTATPRVRRRRVVLSQPARESARRRPGSLHLAPDIADEAGSKQRAWMRSSRVSARSARSWTSPGARITLGDLLRLGEAGVRGGRSSAPVLARIRRDLAASGDARLSTEQRN